MGIVPACSKHGQKFVKILKYGSINEKYSGLA